MFSIFKKKTVVPHVRLTGIIGSAGRFRQGMDLAGQCEISNVSCCPVQVKQAACKIDVVFTETVSKNLFLDQ